MHVPFGTTLDEVYVDTVSIVPEPAAITLAALAILCFASSTAHLTTMVPQAQLRRLRCITLRPNSACSINRQRWSLRGRHALGGLPWLVAWLSPWSKLWSMAPPNRIRSTWQVCWVNCWTA